jgi:hypothetical protein
MERIGPRPGWPHPEFQTPLCGGGSSGGEGEGKARVALHHGTKMRCSFFLTGIGPEGLREIKAVELQYIRRSLERSKITTRSYKFVRTSDQKTKTRSGPAPSTARS